jgi:hypothetical protein
MLVRLLLLAVAVGLAAGLECDDSPSPDAKPNLNLIYTADPVFVREVPNAKLFYAGDGDDVIPIVHLWGAWPDWPDFFIRMYLVDSILIWQGPRTRWATHTACSCVRR